MTTHAIKPGTSSAYTLGTAFCGRGFGVEGVAHISIVPSCPECGKLYHTHLVQNAYDSYPAVSDYLVRNDRFTALNKLSNVELTKIVNLNRK